MRTNVTNTSVEAYRELEASGQQRSDVEVIALHIHDNTRRGERTWIAKAARALGWDKSAVSGRLNDAIEKFGGEVTVDGTTYQIERHAPVWHEPTKTWYPTDPETGRRAISYSARIKRDPGVQAELFA
jgi:hypothetical protein